jgi:hypothetical protein
MFSRGRITARVYPPQRAQSDTEINGKAIMNSALFFDIAPGPRERRSGAVEARGVRPGLEGGQCGDGVSQAPPTVASIMDRLRTDEQEFVLST